MPDLETEDLRTEGGARPTSVAGLPTDGLIIVEPWASWTIQGKKRLIIKSRPFKIGGHPFLLVTRSHALGIIQLSQPTEINLEQFKKLYEEHLIDEAARKRDWPGKRIFYAYRVVMIRVFDRPIEIERPTGPQVLIRDVKFKGDVVALFDISKGDGAALDSFREALRALVPAAEEWTKSVLVYLEGPPEAVRIVRDAPALARRLLEAVGGGAPVKGIPFPRALRDAIRSGRAIARAIQRQGAGELEGAVARRIVGWIKALEEIDDLIPALADVENRPTIVKDSGALCDGGAHRHALRSEVEMTCLDGAHRHVFIAPLDIEFADGSRIEAGERLTTMPGGEHVHALLSGPGSEGVALPAKIDEGLVIALDDEVLVDFLSEARGQSKGDEPHPALVAIEAEIERRGIRLTMATRRAGEHEHRVQLPNGEIVSTLRDGEHRHAVLAYSTGWDGPHVHFLGFPADEQAMTLTSQTPGEYRRAAAAIPAGMLEEDEKDG